MGAKGGAVLFFLIILAIAIIAIVAWNHDAQQMNEMLNQGCVQVAVSGSQQMWECP